MKRSWVAAAGGLAALLNVAIVPAGAAPPETPASVLEAVATLGSGALQFKAENFGTLMKECPTAGEPADKTPKPLDLASQDKVEQLSQGGDDIKVNQDYSCFPHNETSIAVNPRNPRNVVAGQNDYRLGWGTSGFDASTDGGNHWYDGIIPFPSLPSGDNLDGGGDPAVVFDRDGVAYWVGINFNRTDDTNGIFVSRSYNGGFTWTRPCVPIQPAPPSTEPARCGGPGDPRTPGDGVVTFQQDQDPHPNFSVPFNDKEYAAAGPRPTGVQSQCFGPTHQVIQCPPDRPISPDRLYVTWTKFEVIAVAAVSAEIFFSFSDDQGRSWSPERSISGSAPFCLGFPIGDKCNLNQFSTPTVNPTTGLLGVAFQNFNTPDENQYLFVRSRDGGQTFEGPFFVSPVFDVNYPRAGAAGGRPDCTARGQQSGRAVLTNSCFRVNSGGNVIADRRGGPFADDFYVVLSDNRNGTPAKTNVDVFLFKSTDGGSTWIGPTRVNSDPSRLTGDRDDPENVTATGNDQWFPWTDISPKGDLNVVFHDRRLDTTSTLSEWPTSRQFPGNYLAWFWGSVCSITTTATVTQATTMIPAEAAQCLAPEAKVIPQPTAPIDPDGGKQPGQSQAAFPFKNFTLSDVPSNMDYSFRAGIFMGDYNNVAIGPDGTAYGFWTDARNGRSSRSPEQAGRNPACEQADVFVDSYSAQSGGTAKQPPNQDVIDLFSVAPCPAQAVQGG